MPGDNETKVTSSTRRKKPIMSFIQIIQMFAALAVTLGLFGLGVWALRRYGPNVIKRLQDVRLERRMAVVETLMLDTKSRLVLVRVDKEERLVLIGPGQVLDRAKGPGK